MRRAFTKVLISITILLTVIGQQDSCQSKLIPVTNVSDQFYPRLQIKSQPDPIIRDTSEENETTRNSKSGTISIADFKNDLFDGNAGVIRGIYVKDNFALKIIQQPSGQAGFVSTIENVVTEFSMPKKYGVTGLLAHNYLAGNHFFELETDELIQIIYGDGEVQAYKVTQILAFQALQPNSTRSQFMNLSTGEQLSATQMFKLVYTGSHHLTLQTCIQQGEIDTWGRLFVIAEPI